MDGASGQVLVADVKGVCENPLSAEARLGGRRGGGGRRGVRGAAVADSVKYVPWRVSEDDPEVDGERLTCGAHGSEVAGSRCRDGGTDRAVF